MLDVNIEKILPVTEVRDSLNKIIDDVETTDELYVITKNGKPSAIIVGVHHLEKLTGISHDDLMPEEVKPMPDENPAGTTPPVSVNPSTDDTSTSSTSANPLADTVATTPFTTPAPVAPATDAFAVPETLADTSPVVPTPVPTIPESNMSSDIKPVSVDDDIFGTTDETTDQAAAPAPSAPATTDAPVFPPVTPVQPIQPVDATAMGTSAPTFGQAQPASDDTAIPTTPPTAV